MECTLEEKVNSPWESKVCHLCLHIPLIILMHKDVPSSQITVNGVSTRKNVAIHTLFSPSLSPFSFPPSHSFSLSLSLPLLRTLPPSLLLFPSLSTDALTIHLRGSSCHQRHGRHMSAAWSGACLAGSLSAHPASHLDSCTLQSAAKDSPCHKQNIYISLAQIGFSSVISRQQLP